VAHQHLALVFFAPCHIPLLCVVGQWFFTLSCSKLLAVAYQAENPSADSEVLTWFLGSWSLLLHACLESCLETLVGSDKLEDLDGLKITNKSNRIVL